MASLTVDFSRLKSTLLQTGLNQSNQPLFQILSNLIDSAQLNKQQIVASIQDGTLASTSSSTTAGIPENVSLTRVFHGT